MISCSNIIQFHYDTSFILNFISSLYYEIKKKEKDDFNYNIKKFSDLIENLNIQINNQSSSSLSLLSSNTFTFYYKKFESGADNQNELYSSIPENQKPYFGQYGNILIPSTYINNYKLDFNYSYNKKNINSYESECKFREVLDEILKQKPENILGYLTYKIIYYNIIIYNINIQNSVRINYLNKPSLTYNEISIVEPLTPQIEDIRSVINDNVDNIIELNRRFFINTQNDYLMEKNRYREKINSLNTIKDDFKQSQDKFNKSIRNYKYNINNYDMIKKYSKYIAYSLIFMIIIVIILIYFNENLLFIIFIISMIILIYLFSKKFKYINERFVGDTTTYYEVGSITIDTICISEEMPTDFIEATNIAPLVINGDFGENEIRPIINVRLGKGYKLKTPKNQELYNSKIKDKRLYLEFKNYKTISYEEITHIDEILIEEDIRYTISITVPDDFFVKLYFYGGSKLDNINITPTFAVINLQKNKNNYKLIKILLLNGGKNYKTLDNSTYLPATWLNNIDKNANINFYIEKINTYLENKINYNIIDYNIINEGKYIYNPTISLNGFNERCLKLNRIPYNSYIYYKINTISFNSNCYITTIPSDVMNDENEININFNMNINEGEILPIAKAIIGKGIKLADEYILTIPTNLYEDNLFNELLFLILDTGRIFIPFINRVEIENSLIDTRDQLNATHFINITLSQENRRRYIHTYKTQNKISHLIINSLDDDLTKIFFDEDIASSVQPTIYIILNKIRDNIYETSNIYILNGGGNFKNLSRKFNLNGLGGEIRIVEDQQPIDYYELMKDYISITKYNIIRTNVVNGGKFLENNKNANMSISSFDSTCLTSFSTIEYKDYTSEKTELDKITQITNIFNDIQQLYTIKYIIDTTSHISNKYTIIKENIINFITISRINISTLKNDITTLFNESTIIKNKSLCIKKNRYKQNIQEIITCSDYNDLDIINFDTNLNDIKLKQKNIYQKIIQYYLIINDYKINIINNFSSSSIIYNNFKTEIKTLITNAITNKNTFETTLNTIIISIISSSDTNVIITNYKSVLDEIISYNRDINISPIFKLIDYGLSNINDFNTNLGSYKLQNNMNNIKRNINNLNINSKSGTLKLIKKILINNPSGTLVEGFASQTRTLEDLCGDLNAEKSFAFNEYEYILEYLDNAETELLNFLNNDAGSSTDKIQTQINYANISKANLDCYLRRVNVLYDELLTFRTLISSCSVRDLNPTLEDEINKHASVYNFLVPYINNYANTIEEIMNNMRMNVLTLGNKSFIMDKNIYLYELYLKKKKEITEFKLKFTDYVNKTELVRSNSKDLYHFIIFLIITYIIIIIGIYIYLYLIPSLLIVIIFVIIMIITVIIFFTFKLGVSTRMLADKYYWSMMTLKKID